MGFNGGGGVSAVGAHLHTNTAGQGGSLDSTTLMNDAVMRQPPASLSFGLAADATTTSATAVLLTGMEYDCGTDAGMTQCIAAIVGGTSSIGSVGSWQFFDAAVGKSKMSPIWTGTSGLSRLCEVVTYVADNDGQNIELRFLSDDGSTTITTFGTSAVYKSQVTFLEVKYT